MNIEKKIILSTVICMVVSVSTLESMQLQRELRPAGALYAQQLYATTARLVHSTKKPVAEEVLRHFKAQEAWARQEKEKTQKALNEWINDRDSVATEVSKDQAILGTCENL